jgi:hypothetical protein
MILGFKMRMRDNDIEASDPRIRGSATGMLRQRDRALIALVTIARYLSTAQAQRLGWPAKLVRWS